MRRRSEKSRTVVPAEVVDEVRAKLLLAETQLNGVFIKRKDVIRVMLIAHLVRQHYLLVGTPGTAKTAIATSFAKHITGASYFKTMLGSFSTPDKVFGPLDIKRFTNDGEYVHVIKGKLADVELAFLDEFFKANEATLNELLTTLNEREFNGESIPLMTCGMATNWPEVNSRTDNTSALYDRCLLRVAVTDVEKEGDMVKVLEVIDDVEVYRPDPEAMFSLTDLVDAQLAIKKIPISKEVRKLMAGVRSNLAWRMVGNKKKPGIAISSRRLGALQSVLRASAWLNGRAEVTISDFDILQFGLWNDKDDHEHVKAVLENLDSKLCADLIAKIDKARTEYKNLTETDFGTSRITSVTDLIAATVSEVKEIYGKPVFTEGGRLKIDKAMGKLVKDFKAMNKREQKFVEQGA
jgi:MoxR-like ATPase